jgi:hypothetical protein
MLGVVQQGGGASGALFELCVGGSGVRAEAVHHVCSIKRISDAAAVAWVTTNGAFNIPVPVYQCDSMDCASSRCQAWPTDVGCFPGSPPVVVCLRPGRMPSQPKRICWRTTLSCNLTNPEVYEQGTCHAVTIFSILLGGEPLP